MKYQLFPRSNVDTDEICKIWLLQKERIVKIISNLHHLEESLTAELNFIPYLYLLAGNEILNHFHLFFCW